MNIFKQFFKSLYSPKDMARFRFQGIGKTILYVFFISLLSIIPISTYVVQATNEGIDTITTTIKDELPSFSIKNGQLSSKEEQPITIEKKDFTIIFDSTGTIKKSAIHKKDNTIAILKEEFILIVGGQVQATAYSTFSFSFTKDDIVSLLTQINSALPIILMLTIFIFFLIGSALKFIEVSVLALFGLILKNFTGHRIQYQQLWRIAAYCITIPTVFFTIMSALKTTVPNGFLINWVVLVTILYLTLKEIPKPKQTSQQ